MVIAQIDTGIEFFDTMVEKLLAFSLQLLRCSCQLASVTPLGVIKIFL